ncbi:MAG TPA: hypothetical protein VF498_01295 [Anaerolineales bacterium]
MTTQGAKVVETGQGAWRLEIPTGSSRSYQVAQLDNSGSRPRRSFPSRPPFSMKLRARASSRAIPGTWGFGLWNDPFGMGIVSGAEALRLPALPNAAWFFFASPPSYLSLRDDLPAQGWLAATFRGPRRPLPWLILAAPTLPLIALPPTARLLRRLGRRLAVQDAALLPVDPTEWRRYELDWSADQVIFRVDDRIALQTGVVPRPPLGLVIWVDNQYAALEPNGRLRFGALPEPQPAWIEIEGLVVS